MPRGCREGGFEVGDKPSQELELLKSFQKKRPTFGVVTLELLDQASSYKLLKVSSFSNLSPFHN